jgi:ribosome small subunit-dependent GTPase A
MPQGVIVKGVGGFYYVESEDTTYECRARGKFRNMKITPLVGDNVEITVSSGGCAIDSILPRKNELVRPSVSNIDQLFIVFAASKPDPNLNLLDRLLLFAEYNKLNAIICINKIDLMNISEVRNMMAGYEKAGYRVIYTSTHTGEGVDEVRGCIRNGITVFSGPSGVGKSSLLNSINPSFKLKTGDISDKIGRGKHTTRHVELFGMEGGGYIVDTPGFSSLEIDGIDANDLDGLFPEFQHYLGLCRFSACRHINEPDCAVKEAVFDKLIDRKRYESYIWFFNEIAKNRRKQR